MLSVAELKARLFSRRRAAADALAADANAFLDDAADGKLSDTEIDEGLERHNFTPEELATAIEQRANRRNWQSVVADEPDALKAQSQNEAAHNAAKAAYESALAKYQTARALYLGKASELESRLLRIDHARRQLQRSAPAPARRSVQAAGDKIATLGQRIAELRNMLDAGSQHRNAAGEVVPTFAGRRMELQARIERTKRENHFDERKHVDGWRDELASIDRDEKQARADLSKLEGELKAAHVDFAKVRETTLVA